MISKRTLEKWRKEALIFLQATTLNTVENPRRTNAERILKLTQELIDQHLLGK